MPKARKPKEVAKILQKEGFSVVRQRGSHAIFNHPDGRRTVVPIHNKDIPPGTMHNISKQSGVIFK